MAGSLTTSAAPDPSASPKAPVVRLAFVGERRSRRAVELGVYWENGRLAAKTLHEALRAIGLDPKAQIYLNLFPDDETSPSEAALDMLQELVEQGVTIVGMGRVVQKALERARIPHLPMIHPAARGAIRARARYQAHVTTVLGAVSPLA